MTVSEHLMRPGTFNLRFVPEVPVSITNQIVNAMEAAGGAGAHIVITPGRVDLPGVPVAGVLSQATYTGRITKRPSRLSVEGVGILDWLNTYPTTLISRTAGTPTQWVGDLIANGITAGTITDTGASSVSRSFGAYLATKREMLDAVASAGSWEYIVQPDFTIDAAIATTLFASHTTPDLVVTRREEGPDVNVRGVDGGLLDQALDDSQLATQVAVIPEVASSGAGYGTASQALTLKTWNGSTPTLVDAVSSPGTPNSSANGVASSTLNLRGPRREVSVSSRTYALHRFASPGDYVWLWDPPSGLYDLGTVVQFRGETISPAKVRLLSWTWPIEPGLGVYLLLNGTTPTLVDLSDWVETETSETFWTVGDWNPSNVGPVNRTAPMIEQRIVDSGRSIEMIAYTPSGNVDASTGGYTNWATLGTMTVPTWATKIRVSFAVTGVYTITAASSYRLRIRAGTTGPVSAEVFLSWIQTSNRRNVSATVDISAPPTGSQSLIVQAERAAGTGQMRADTTSRFTAAIEYF